MAECPHGLDDPAWCSICRHGPLVRETPTVIATFAARWDGDCPECGFPIVAGQVIHRLSNDRYVHQACG